METLLGITELVGFEFFEQWGFNYIGWLSSNIEVKIQYLSYNQRILSNVEKKYNCENYDFERFKSHKNIVSMCQIGS